MFNIIKQWLKERRFAKAEDDYMRGYNYAAGQLLMHGFSVEGQLYVECDGTFDRGQFDVGMWAAIHDYRELVRNIAAGVN